MKSLKLLALSLLVLLMAVNAQAGYLTPGLERQIAGESGDEITKVLVVLKDQADINSLNWELHDSKANKDVRHLTVLRTLQDLAQKSQGELLASLDAGKSNGRILGYTPHWLINGVVVVGTIDAIRQIAEREDVECVEADLIIELIEPIQSGKEIQLEKDGRGIGVTPGVQAVNAPLVWTELGIDGTGVVVGVLDTGVDGTHPALADRWRGNFAPAEECWLDAANLGDPDFPVDRHYHGTHVMGTITGLAPDDTIGVAPGAVWIASNIINSSIGPDFDNGVIASLEFMADPDGNPETTIDMPAVVQNSWGINESMIGYYNCDSRWWDAIDNCEAAGVCLIWSAGNHGPGVSSLRSPADRAASPTNCFSVGSTVAYPPYTISNFSSRGPSGCGGEFAMKPEVCAPGSDIYSAQPGGGYQLLSGTSMSGPHIAGVVALMEAANPNIDVITIKEVLMATAVDLGPVGEDNTYGHGFVDAYQAVLGVMSGIGTIEGIITDSATGLPVEGAVVRKIGGFNFDYTNANGYYSMTMPIDDAEFSVGKFGYYDGSFFTTISEDDTVTENLAIDPMPSAAISGIIYGPDGDAVEGAQIRATNTPLMPVYSDATGFYSITLPSGPGQVYDMVGRTSGMGAQVQTVELLIDMTLDFNLPGWTGDDFETGNFNRFPWEMTGAGWTIDSGTVYEGAYSAQSQQITHNQTTTLDLTQEVLAAGEIRFWYKVSSEANFDYLRFLVDGELIYEWAGDIDWTEFVHMVEPGLRTFSFVYDKDNSIDSGSDTAWIDFVELPPVDLPGIPQISVDTTAIEIALHIDGTADMPFLIENLGDGGLNFALNLVETDAPLITVTNPVPFGTFGKDDIDDRAPVSPIAGFGGPDEFGYFWIDSDEAAGPTYVWVDISQDGQIAGGGDDANHGPFSLGFDFSYYGNTFSTINICTNGWLSFTSTGISYTNQGIPTAGAPNNLLAPFWDNLNPNDGGTIYYRNEPNRFIVQWQEIHHYGGSGMGLTFQVILNTDGSIIYQYELVQDVGGCTVGIENAGGNDGLLVAFNDDGYLHDGLAIRLATAPPLTWVTADPLTGMIPETASTEINLSFDAMDLELGIYQAVLVISSNDPVNDLIQVPVVLNVVEAAGIEGIGNDIRAGGVTGVSGVYPNPFNPLTTIEFSVARTQHVTLSVYNVLGQRVKTLVDQVTEGGIHPVQWNGTDSSGRGVSSGTYFVRMITEEDVFNSKLMLVR